MTTNLANFCKRENLELPTLYRMLGLASAIARAGEHECNGDHFTLYHDSSVDMNDKNVCAQLWGKHRDQLLEKLSALVVLLGFDAVELHGLYPSLRRNGRDVFLPFPSPQSITIIGRRWFDRVNGNTYNTAEILVDGEFVHKTPMEYGYGDHYRTVAEDWLIENGFISKDRGHPLWQYCEDNEIVLTTSVCDVKKRDL